MSLLGHVQRRLLDAPVRKSDNIIINDNVSRGRSKLTWRKTIRNDLIACGLSNDLAFDRFE